MLLLFFNLKIISESNSESLVKNINYNLKCGRISVYNLLKAMFYFIIDIHSKFEKKKLYKLSEETELKLYVIFVVAQIVNT